MLSIINHLQMTVPTYVSAGRDEHAQTIVPRKSTTQRRWQKNQLALIELEVRAKIDSDSCRWSNTEVDALRERVGPEPRNLRQKINDIHKSIKVCKCEVFLK